MAEQLDVAAPVSPPAVTHYQVMRLTLEWDLQAIGIILLGSDGKTYPTGYGGAEAVALMQTLNTANLSVKSLHKRVLEKLAADGKLPPGTVTGVPG